MRLLVVTQKVDKNDDNLGFFHRWLEEFAKNVEQLTVVCLFEGEHSLPENTRVFSLGKEKGGGKIKYLFRFWWLIWRERNNYDAVFVHMNPIYVVVGGLCWRMLGKRVVFWYAHGSVSSMLKLAHKFAHRVVTSTKEGFRLPSNKVQIVGQGIDLDLFSYSGLTKSSGNIVTVGRVSKSKRLEVLTEAVRNLKQKGTPVSLRIIGGLGEGEDRSYSEGLEDLAKGLPVEFAGPKNFTEVVDELKSSLVFVSAGSTGSLDKVILEAMAVGLPVITCNEAATKILSKWKDLVFEKDNPEDLSKKIERVVSLGAEERDRISRELREIVARDHSLDSLTQKIISVASGQNNE